MMCSFKAGLGQTEKVRRLLASTALPLRVPLERRRVASRNPRFDHDHRRRTSRRTSDFPQLALHSLRIFTWNDRESSTNSQARSKPGYNTWRDG
jgi:hypothetical protein